MTTTPLTVSVIGIGLWGHGHENWEAFVNTSRKPTGNVRASELDDVAKPKTPQPSVIPARERRRAPLAVKLAVEVASQAFPKSGFNPTETACVFASGMGDTEITDHMCRAVATVDKLLSPTKFHNSVHNAAAGYWTISTQCQQPASSVSGFDNTVAIALLEACIQCTIESRPILLVAFDVPTPPPMQDIVAIDDAFGFAMLLSDQPTDVNLQLNVACRAIDNESKQNEASIEDSPLQNPATRLLPVLTAIACDESYQGYYPVGTGTHVSVELFHSTATERASQGASQ